MGFVGDGWHWQDPDFGEDPGFLFSSPKGRGNTYKRMRIRAVQRQCSQGEMTEIACARIPPLYTPPTHTPLERSQC